MDAELIWLFILLMISVIMLRLVILYDPDFEFDPDTLDALGPD